MYMAKRLSKLSSELKSELLGVFLVALGTISLMSLFDLNIGTVGQCLLKLQTYMFGVFDYIFPLIIIGIGLHYIIKRKFTYTMKFGGLILLYIIFLVFYHQIKIPINTEILPDSLPVGGGFIGGIILLGLHRLVGVFGTYVVLFSLTICSFVMITESSPFEPIIKYYKPAYHSLRNIRLAKISTASTKVKNISMEDTIPIQIPRQVTINSDHFYNQELVTHKTENLIPIKEELVEEYVEPEIKLLENVNDNIPKNMIQYVLPPISLLRKSSKYVKNTGEINQNVQIIEETLRSFKVNARVINIFTGPSVTRYEVEPAPGVKVNRIVNLSDDLALKLAAQSIRIEAPIPGKAAIGIEVPNKDNLGVQLREVLETCQKNNSKLIVGLGKDIAGKVVTMDLSKMPHLLIAGTTGAGKSVCINTIITSILFRTTPEEIKFILIDPKMVELSNYNGIPHLITPVVTDAKQAAQTLHWAVEEMEYRYMTFAKQGIRDIERYNQSTDKEKLPFIVIIIDELADLMMVAPGEVEDSICRLAQKARAAGIHLVLATQRPSVNVITGLIKANMPSRISFAVSSHIDSRTILDCVGAEKLLGKGDMLYSPIGTPKPVRVQGAFIADSEVQELIDFIKKQGEPQYNDKIIQEISETLKQEEVKFDDELLKDAITLVLETGQASVSILQRKFRIGYSRAARLIDTMEQMKIVGPYAGSKARDVIMNYEQVHNLYFKNK